jgi:hypothetical protein
MRKTVTFALGLAFLIVGLSACGGGGGNAGPNEISGVITLATTGQPVPQVSLTLFGSGSGNTFTDANGFYIFSGLQDGVYNIVPSKTGYTFLLPELTVSISGQNLTDQNFLAYAIPPTTPAATDVVDANREHPEDPQTGTDAATGFPAPFVLESIE